MFRCMIFLAALFYFATPSKASVTLQVNGEGTLTGAAGVDVNGTIYDVTFVDGSCASVFSFCNEASDFDFQTSVDATAAAQALLNQVFIDGPLGLFDTNGHLTQGCAGFGVPSCIVEIPYDLTDNEFSQFGLTFNAIAALNVGPLDVNGQELDLVFQSGGFRSQPADEQITFARFTLGNTAVSAVPEPATWAMLLLGFSFLGGAMRSAKHRKKLTTASVEP